MEDVGETLFGPIGGTIHDEVARSDIIEQPVFYWQFRLITHQHDTTASQFVHVGNLMKIIGQMVGVVMEDCIGSSKLRQNVVPAPTPIRRGRVSKYLATFLAKLSSRSKLLVMKVCG